MTQTDLIILAAGKGTRMKSERAKVLHPVAGWPLLAHVLAAAGALEARRTSVVVGPGMDEAGTVARRCCEEAAVAVQTERLGTAHAVGVALETLPEAPGAVLVLYGDTPLIAPETLKRLEAAIAEGAGVAVLAFRAGDPTGYGRMIRDREGALVAIREEADATEAERAIDLCNSGVMAFDAETLRRLLPLIGNDNAKGEYYLTDMVMQAVSAGVPVALVECAEEEVLGINTRAELARAERIMQDRLRAAAMAGGATLVAPETVFLCRDTRIGTDVLVEPHVVFGPGVAVGNGATVRAFCHIEAAEIGEGAVVGPFARLRPGAEIGGGAHVGNFVEVKNARLGEGAKANHLAYLGDADIGARANIGAGTITCNYDGVAKHRTVVGADAFVGSNSSLVAPVTVGEGAYVGSGSVISDDVAPGALALGRARQVEKPGRAAEIKARALKGKETAGE